MRGTIVFDLDGTLVESAPDIMATLNHLLKREGIAELPVSAARYLVGAGAKALLQRGFEAAGAPLSPARLDALFDDFLDYYYAHIADYSHLFPGVEKALKQLQARAFTLAICTNKPTLHSEKLVAALGIRPYFSGLAGRDSFAFSKPDPRHLTETIRLAGGDITQAIMVGDSATDVDTAKAAGIPVIGVTFGYTSVPMNALGADEVIDHFDALVEGVERIFSSKEL